jgi:hypothetical protein
MCRYDPEMDGRILLGKVDCTEEVDLCRRSVTIETCIQNQHDLNVYDAMWNHNSLLDIS